MEKIFKLFTLTLVLIFVSLNAAQAVEESQELKVIETTAPLSSTEQTVPPGQSKQLALVQAMPASQYQDPLKYTLGPDDVIEIIVMRHPEFSGTYPVNLEGKIQYKFVGDIDVNNLSKKEVEDKIKSIVANFVVSPEVSVTVLEYKSKVIYVLGEVGQPGKYYMRSEAIPIREAVVQAGLPTQAAAMRKCSIITPDKNGKAKTRNVNLYAVLYGGNLKYNLELHAGDVLYVPCTIMAKLVRMINPVTATVQGTAGTPSGIRDTRGAVSSLAK